MTPQAQTLSIWLPNQWVRVQWVSRSVGEGGVGGTHMAQGQGNELQLEVPRVSAVRDGA